MRAGAPCETWVLEVTERASLGRSPERPDVLVSGALHGDEIVGPLVTLELGRWLLRRQAAGDAWARRLVRTRRLLLLPLTNAVGFAQRTRRELQHDPNRDFPYQPSSPSACMTTVAARSVNELLRAHLLQLVITFHAGMQALAYVWGDFAHRGGAAHNRSPDHAALQAVAAAAGRYAGSGLQGSAASAAAAAGRGAYPQGPMNDAVYPVHGGMEDWAYAASWDAPRLTPCRPLTHGGYAAERTATYENATARAAVYLVETSDAKQPFAASLGRPAHALRAGAAGDGHVPRNLRLSLAMIDLVQPYVEIIGLDAPADAARGGGGWPACLAAAAAARAVAAARCCGGACRGAIRVDRTHAVWRRADDRGAARWRPASPPTAGDGVWASARRRAAAAAAVTTTRRRAASSARVWRSRAAAAALLPRRRRGRRRRVGASAGGAAGVAARRAAADASRQRAHRRRLEPRGQRPPRAGPARVALGGRARGRRRAVERAPRRA